MELPAARIGRRPITFQIWMGFPGPSSITSNSARCTILPPSALPDGLEDRERNLREDLLRALERRYPPKYEELIKRYFRSLSESETVPDLP